MKLAQLQIPSLAMNTIPVNMVSIPDGRSQSPQQDNDNDNDNDWRAFKAGLVQQEQYEQQHQQQQRTSWFSRNTARKDDKALRKLGKEMLKTWMMIHLVVEENDDDEDDDCSTE